jgi:hypothetical protein
MVSQLDTVAVEAPFHVPFLVIGRKIEEEEEEEVNVGLGRGRGRWCERTSVTDGNKAGRGSACRVSCRTYRIRNL